jgi:hypothetical protein
MLSAAEIFARVLELEPAEREDFLRTSCRDDEALQAEVISLLKALPDAEVYFQNAWQEIWGEDHEPDSSEE